MKILVVVLLVVGLGVALYVNLVPGKEEPPTAAPPTQAVPVWEQPLPEGVEQVPEDQVRLNVRAERRNDGGRVSLEFHLTEEHGYLVDGIRLTFWYQFKDDDTGETVNDATRVDYFVRDRLEFDETLVTRTVLREIDFPNLSEEDLAATTSEDWGVRVVAFARAGRRAQ